MHPTLIITSCQAFAAQSVPRLLASLERCGYPAGQAIVVWDGPNANGGGLTWLHTDLRCFEMSGPMEWSKHAELPFLAIHDTCIAGPRFTEAAYVGYHQMLDANADAGGNLPGFMHCCIGFFHPRFIREHHTQMAGLLHETGKRAAVDFEISNRLGNWAGNKYLDMGWRIVDGIRHVDIYSTGTPRWERHFPGLDLYKYTLSNTVEGVSEVPVI